MTVQYDINPIVKPRLDEIVEAMNERYPLNVSAENLNPPQTTKHYYINGREVNPDVYDYNDYADRRIPTYEEVLCYAIKMKWHMTFNADDFYNRCAAKGWKDKQGEQIVRWTSVMQKTVDMGWCKGTTPVDVRWETPMPISIIKRK